MNIYYDYGLAAYCLLSVNHVSIRYDHKITKKPESSRNYTNTHTHTYTCTHTHSFMHTHTHKHTVCQLPITPATGVMHVLNISLDCFDV